MYRCEKLKRFNVFFKRDLYKCSKLKRNPLNSMNPKIEFGAGILMLMLAKNPDDCHLDALQLDSKRKASQPIDKKRLPLDS